jgi:hypothetical protein
MRKNNQKQQFLSIFMILVILLSNLAVIGENETTEIQTTENQIIENNIVNNQTINNIEENIVSIENNSVEKIQISNITINSSIINQSIEIQITNNTYSMDNDSGLVEEITETVYLNESQENYSENISIPLVETIMLSSETTNIGSGGMTSYYVELDNITDSESNYTPFRANETPEEKVSIECIDSENTFNRIIGNLPLSITCDQIITNKKIEENNIEIIIKSDQHINDSIKIYNEIPKLKKDETSMIQVIHMNDNTSLENLEFFDTDNDEYYEGISWIIPHLSEQVYRIILNYTKTENLSSDKIGLTMIDESVLKQNPIKMDFNISYSNLTNLECIFTIDNIPSPETYKLGIENFSIKWPYNLINGNHSWLFLCKDRLNPSIENSTTGIFIINENFSINLDKNIYLIGENVSITINSKNTTTLSIIDPNNNKIYENILESDYPKELSIDGKNFTLSGKYMINLTTDYFEDRYSWNTTINIAKINFSSDKINAKVNETNYFYINIESPIETSCLYLDFGDNNNTGECPNTKSIIKTINHQYKNSGNYTPKLNVMINSKNFSFSGKSINITNPYDTENPKVYLIEPSDDSIIKNTSVKFIYRAEDNTKLNNCTFSLYNAIGSSWAWSYGENDLVYRKVNSSLSNNQEVYVQIDSLSKKNYFWEVSCYDNSTNNKKQEYFLTINTNETNISTSSEIDNTDNSDNTDLINRSYEEKPRLEEIMNLLNEFIKNQDNFSIEQKQVLDDLGITVDLSYYNKRLNQIDQDFGYNLKYVKDENLREKRRIELLNEMENISKNIPSSIEVKNQKDYVKNSLTIDLEKLIIDYLSYLGESPDKNELKKIAEGLFKIQGNLDVSTKIREIEIVYSNYSKKMTVITKDIKLKNESFNTILEIIPKEILDSNKIYPITEIKKIDDSGIFEINSEDIINNKIIYYFEGDVTLDQVEDIDTLLYHKFIVDGVGITGFSILEFRVSNWSYYLAFFILLIFIFYLILAGLKKNKISGWKKQENVRTLFKLIKESKTLMKRKETEPLKEKYHKIKEIYPLVPEECKSYKLKDIKEIQLYLDKRYINDLVKEYRLSKKEKRTNDSMIIYNKIKDTYKRLPKKDREKINKKLSED